MAKKSKASQKHEMSTEEQARAARREQVVDKYGEPDFACDYKLDPYVVNEMGLLIGVPNDRVWINTLAIILSGLLVLMLMWDNSLVGLGVALVIVIVVIMTIGERINRIKASYLRSHGYDVANMSDQELVREVYVTESDVVVECPGVNLDAYPLTDLRYARSNPEYLLASFGKGRYVLFPRKGFSLSNYTRLTKFLEDKAPVRWYHKLASLAESRR